MKNTQFSHKETFFEIHCVVPSRSSELWNWYCFEKGALGIQTMEESTFESTFRIFFDKKPIGGAKKLVDAFHIEISKEKNIKILDEIIRPVENWQENWNEHFSPLFVGKSLIILPSWENSKKLYKRFPIWIDPGQAFGTGNHISTVLALEKLEKYLLSLNIIPETMLDVGIGTGILSIAACRLGVKKVKGVDIEEKTLEEVKKNTKLNGLCGRIETIVGQPFMLKAKAPLVICNMLLQELLTLRYEFFNLTNPQGTLICSGILKKQELELIEAICQVGFNFCSSRRSQKWSAVRFERKL